MTPPTPPPPLPPSSGSTGYTFLTDANGHPITELYQALHEMALRISSAVPDPAQWTNLIIYLLASLENQQPGNPSVESTLDNVCRLVIKRMNTGKWDF